MAVDPEVYEKFALQSDVNTFWLLFGAILVFFMQTGFAMLEVGSVQLKNTKNILIKNIIDAAVGAIAWWVVGYGIAFGEDHLKFFGRTNYGTHDVANYSFWLFQWAFSATAATIVSGAVAERVNFEAYIVYSVILSAFLYPFVVHWGWGGGFASSFRGNEAEDLLLGCGVLDFAGSGVVHMVGGVAALVACIMIGPRKDRFSEKGIEYPAYNPIFQCLGTLILFMGWFGFNGVSTIAITGYGNVAGLAMATTALAASSGCLSAIFTGRIMEGYVEYSLANNGILAGLVAITASCSVVDMEGAFVIGIVAGILYYFASKLLVKLKIDDVVDAVPVHLVNGIWGVIAAGLFATKENYAAAYAQNYNNGDSRAQHCAGAFYGGSGHQLGANVIFICVILAWVGVIAFVMFKAFDLVFGLRVMENEEELGLDRTHHEKSPVTIMTPQANPGVAALSADDDVELSEIEANKVSKQGYARPAEQAI